ncbi:MAG: pseudouridine synthase [Burkholderiales bacterium]|nr:pseudouridine synthase [Burkholderiales bacterium]MBH2017246.1 pseudouridine synthase [Burkholderiales bacterium]
MPESNDSTPLVEEAAKPKRTRRAKPAPEQIEAVAPEAVSAQAPAEPSESAQAAAPKRAPRRRKAEAEEGVAPELTPVAETAQVEAATAVDAQPAPAKRAPRRKAVAAESVAPESVASSADVAEAPVLAQAPVASVASADAAGEVADGPGGAEGDRGERPPRGQRRRDGRPARDGREGREDREARGPREDRQPAQAGDPAVDEAAEPTELRLNRRANMAQQQATEVFAELLSGDFDKVHEEEAEEASAEDSGPYKRVLRPEPDAPKLQKVLAQAGVGSRRDIEQMIEDGRIEVNDQVAHIGQRISHGDRVKVAGKPIKIRIAPPAARILAYHKPVGEVVTHDDPQGRPTVFRRLPRLQNGKWMSVGRLDLNTEGLLLFTNSGELANQLMHPRFGVEREYAVRVLGSLDDAARERLLTGVDIEGQSASFVSISNGLGEGVNQWYRVVITEGRNREVRKLFDAVGLTVNRLIRVRYGAIVLPRGLRRGVWVELGESDVRAVKSLAGMDRHEQESGQGQGRGGKQQPRQKAQQGQRGQNAQGGAQQGAQQGQGGQQGQRGKPHGQGRGGQPGQGQGGRPQQGPFGGQGQRPPRGNEDRPRQASHDGDDDFDHIGPIPNPLEQTFDKRFVKGSKRITSGFGRPDQDHGRDAGGKNKGPKQPDPMQTSVGYIGADAYFGGGRSGGNRRGGGGGGGGGGRGRR